MNLQEQVQNMNTNQKRVREQNNDLIRDVQTKKQELQEKEKTLLENTMSAYNYIFHKEYLEVKCKKVRTYSLKPSIVQSVLLRVVSSLWDRLSQKMCQ